MVSVTGCQTGLGFVLLGLAACSSPAATLDGGVPATIPSLLRPSQGEFTGSVWAEKSLRPTFRWSAVNGASTYEIQLQGMDPTCLSPSECDFASTVVDAQTSSTSYRPDHDLPVSMTAPVGERYFWRVRACFADGCRGWSATQHVEVGRQRQDFNGDGYGDLALSTPLGAAVYYGGPGRTSAQAGWSVTGPIDGENLGAAVTFADVNADGFADLAFVACPSSNSTPENCSVWIYFGGQSPSQGAADLTVGTTSDLLDYPQVVYGGDSSGTGVVDLVASQAMTGLATSWIGVLSGASGSMATTILAGQVSPVVGGCDLDADGKIDLLTSASGQLVTLHASGSGQVAAIETSSVAAVGSPLACAGDMDGSGHATVVMEIPGAGLALRQSGGGTCDGQILSPVDGGVSSPVMAGMMDLDGDGVQDLVVGDKAANRIVVFYGGACPPQRSAGWSFTAGNGSLTGYAVASPGDMDGDGFDELAVSGPIAGIDSFISGNVYIFRGGSALGSAPDSTLTGTGNFGLFID